MCAQGSFIHKKNWQNEDFVPNQLLFEISYNNK